MLLACGWTETLALYVTREFFHSHVVTAVTYLTRIWKTFNWLQHLWLHLHKKLFAPILPRNMDKTYQNDYPYQRYVASFNVRVSIVNPNMCH